MARELNGRRINSKTRTQPFHFSHFVLFIFSVNHSLATSFPFHSIPCLYHSLTASFSCHSILIICGTAMYLPAGRSTGKRCGRRCIWSSKESRVEIIVIRAEPGIA